MQSQKLSPRVFVATRRPNSTVQLTVRDVGPTKDRVNRSRPCRLCPRYRTAMLRREQGGTLQVFLSWSGARSAAVAETLAKWLSQVIQAVEPWVSVDIDKGVRWGPEIAGRLEKSKVGVICLTPENLESRWILFEAGALSKTTDAYVCTFLLNLAPAEVEPPLSQFQHTAFEKEDVLRLVRTVNTAVARIGERALADTVLTEVFETFWPQLEQRLRVIASEQQAEAPPKRAEADILDEILTTVRSMERRQVADETTNILRHALYARTPSRSRPADVWYRMLSRHAQELGEADVEVLLNYMTYLLAEREKKKTDAPAEAGETAEVPKVP